MNKKSLNEMKFEEFQNRTHHDHEKQRNKILEPLEK